MDADILSGERARGERLWHLKVSHEALFEIFYAGKTHHLRLEVGGGLPPP